MAKPLDPRLLHHARAARRYVMATAALGMTTAALVVVQAVLIAWIVAGVVMEGRTPAEVSGAVVALALVLGARSAVAGVQERFGGRTATAVVSQLRAAVLQQATDPRRRGRRAPLDAAGLTTLTTRGLDGLDGYLTRYLPQLLLAATVTPAVLVVVLWFDRTAGLTILATLPLVPLFMALVGLATQESANRRLRTLQVLGTQVLDLVAGLPTLRALGAEQGQGAVVRRVGEAYRRATMRTLRSAFLSAFVLETLTTLSVALVAVGVGLRLVGGDLDLRTGLTVLLLAPEVYLPLRLVGLHYHASVDGVAAADQALAMIDEPLPENAGVPAPDLRHAVITLHGVSVVHRDSDGHGESDERPEGFAAPDRLEATFRPGTVVALVGDSGAGKSTATQVLLGLRPPDAGRVIVQVGGVVDSVDLADIDLRTWWAQTTWVPQHPVVVPGTLAENARLTSPQADDDELAAAARLTGLDVVVAAAPLGWQTPLGLGGLGLSAGERQRLALTRALLRDTPVVVLDEPSAHLDAASEEVVLAVVRRWRAQGRTVVVVAHRASLTALADDVVVVAAERRVCAA